MGVPYFPLPGSNMHLSLKRSKINQSLSYAKLLNTVSFDGLDMIINLCPYLSSLRSQQWVKWLRMQGHRLPATLEVTGLNPGPGKINLNKN